MSSDDEEPPPSSLLQQQSNTTTTATTTTTTTTTLTHGHSYPDAPLSSIQRLPLPPVVGSAGKDLPPRRHIQPQQRFRPYHHHRHHYPRNNNNNNNNNTSFHLDLDHEQELLLPNKHTDKPASNNKVKEPDKQHQQQQQQQLDLFGSIPEPSAWSSCSLSSSLSPESSNFRETICDDDTIFTEFAQLTADSSSSSSPPFCLEDEFTSSSSSSDAGDDFVLFP